MPDEIALRDLHIDQVIPKALGPDSTVENRHELLLAIEQRRKLVDSLHKNAAAVVPVERVMAFLAAVSNILIAAKMDRREKLIVLEKLRALTGRPPNH